MIFYHGTSEECWKMIQQEGVLWGTRTYPDGRKRYRYTYLTPEVDIAAGYGDVILEVEYEPVGVDGTGTDNYGFDPPPGMICWQFSVFIPIPISNVRKMDKAHLSTDFEVEHP